MILTMILSSLLGAFISGAYFSRTTSDGRAARNDSQLSQLDLGDACGFLYEVQLSSSGDVAMLFMYNVEPILRGVRTENTQPTEI